MIKNPLDEVHSDSIGFEMILVIIFFALFESYFFNNKAKDNYEEINIISGSFG